MNLLTLPNKQRTTVSIIIYQYLIDLIDFNLENNYRKWRRVEKNDNSNSYGNERSYDSYGSDRRNSMECSYNNDNNDSLQHDSAATTRKNHSDPAPKNEELWSKPSTAATTDMIQSSSATTNALSAGTVASSEFAHSEKDVERLKQQLQQNNYFDSTANAADNTTATNMIDTTTTAAATTGSSDGTTTNPVYAKKWGKK